MSDLPYSFNVSLAEIPASGLEITLAPEAPVLAALARHAGVLDVSGLAATLRLRHEGADGVHVTGTLDATVRQACGVTLDPFDAPLHEAIDVHFVPAGTSVDPELAEDEAYDPPDEIEAGGIDLGALVCEFLALGIDPYPRKPGAVFEPPAEDAAAASPFSALSRLKDRT